MKQFFIVIIVCLLIAAVPAPPKFQVKTSKFSGQFIKQTNSLLGIKTNWVYTQMLPAYTNTDTNEHWGFIQQSTNITGPWITVLYFPYPHEDIIVSILVHRTNQQLYFKTASY